MAFQVIPVFIVLYPAVGSLVAETSILVALLLQSGLLFSTKVHTAFSVAIIAASMAFVYQVPTYSWSDETVLEAPPLLAVVFFGIFTTLFAVASGVIKNLLARIAVQKESMNRMDITIKNLSEANTTFLEQAQTAGRDAATRERKRISREIHDSVGHALVNIIMMLEAASKVCPTGNNSLANLLWQAKAQAAESLNETRRAVHLLRNRSEEHVGTLIALKRLTESFSVMTGIEVEIEFGNTPAELPDNIGAAVYRSLQEGLTNAFRHAGATRVFVYLRTIRNRLLLDIKDNGRGSTASHSGSGLQGMQERAAELGGTFTTRNSQTGFQIYIEIPLTPAQEDMPA